MVSDSAAKKIAGDNVGLLPLLLYPLVKQRVQSKLFPGQPAQPQAEAPPAVAPNATPVGCEACRQRS